jgi:hypothetical protein
MDGVAGSNGKIKMLRGVRIKCDVAGGRWSFLKLEA